MSTAIVLCDGQGRMVQGNRQLLARLDEVPLSPGFCASEAAAGTNGVGTALVERQPVFILGREHYADCLSPFVGAGAPVRNPLRGRIEATLGLTCLRDDGDPVMLRLVRKAAHDIEARLLEQATDREQALLTAYHRAPRGTTGDDDWCRRPEDPAWAYREEEHDRESLGRVDLAVLREKAGELIASPDRNLDEVTLSGGRVATLLCRPIMGAAGESGVVVEARILGGPHLRHAELTTPSAMRPAAARPATTPIVILRTAAPPSPQPRSTQPADRCVSTADLGQQRDA
ncbi:hypothetical protein ABZ851_31490 [Streptomyces sp. NPDC047049]|uniref:hypothetical protein n=1 Tax=Streptomyces sp. NPDC047049 TaxID=3156688 RepID=UPI0034084B73